MILLAISTEGIPGNAKLVSSYPFCFNLIFSDEYLGLMFYFDSITALAASGGTGVLNSKPSKGAYVSAKFNLTKGEELFLLVGQKGESACSTVREWSFHSVD